ncbi:PREDICTED: nascent polypeptide-associated complex subunit alpha, muscle-specific form-like [Gekko japonicus]|uniref:Nascent polypeptide-associated complex subunit alpha, muscle-specific form-like n=1 Tax=Gekko japonicus TaxID=146911 RepID=A0ABM1L8G1_GEKJA|nr:PREDICTED: nascent polypeptide-associated complex subunit alpha, muscle-specific form-like [Gekko japonicus]
MELERVRSHNCEAQEGFLPAEALGPGRPLDLWPRLAPEVSGSALREELPLGVELLVPPTSPWCPCVDTSGCLLSSQMTMGPSVLSRAGPPGPERSPPGAPSESQLAVGVGMVLLLLGEVAPRSEGNMLCLLIPNELLWCPVAAPGDALRADSISPISSVGDPELPAAQCCLRMRRVFLAASEVRLQQALLVGQAERLKAGLIRWHRLHSKPGKKEKERGEIQVSIHFTRHSLTASMFDLSVKDKPRSPFGKLRDKMKGRRQYDLESASAIVPSSSGALEEDLGLGGKKAKGGGGGFFFKNKLRKSSLTQSSTSLGSDSTVSSASSVAGVAASESPAAPSPSRHGSLPPDRSVRDFLPSPKLTHKRAFSDEVSQINPLPESRSVQSLKPQSEPISRSSLCINGSHVYCEEPSPRPAAPLSRPKKPPAESFGTGPPAPDSELPPWSGSSFQRPPQKDPPRFIPSPPILAAQEEDKLSVKTLALHKQRSRAKMEEGAPAEAKPVQVALPMVFSAGAGRGRPPEEARKEEEKGAKAGFFRRGGTKEDAGKSRVAEGAGHGGPEGEKSSSWFSMKDARDPSQRPSSQSGLPAATEVTKDTCVCEDRGPSSAFLGAGTPQPESAPPSMSAFEPAAAAGPPPEWGDPFDAFATSRLRPGAPREPPPNGDAASEGLADQDRPEEEMSPPHPPAGLPLRWPSEPGGSLGVAPEETLVGGESRLGEQPWGRPGHSPSGACEEAAMSGASLNHRQVPPRAAVEAEAADPWGEAWEALAAGAPAPATHPDSELPLGLALESHASQPGSLEKKSPPRSPTESQPERPAVLPLGTRSPASEASEAEAGEDASADVCRWDAARQEQAAPQMPPAPGRQPAPGEGLLPEEADELGGSAEEPRGGEEGGQEGTEPAPPKKPPRSFTPLSLAEEADEALWGARPRCESQEGPGGEADGQGPPGGGGGSSCSTPWVIGAGGGSVGCGAEGLLLPPAGDGPAGANEQARPAGSWGDSQPAAGEQLETCPGKPGLAGAGGEPLSALPLGSGPLPFPRPLPVAEEGGLGPSGTPQGPEPSPPVLFWTALEEQLLLPQSPEGASPERPRGLHEGTSDREPSLERGGGVALASPEADRTGSQSGWAPPACPQAFLASGTLSQGPGDLELSSSWSDDRVLDFKKADFWQAERGEGSSAPGNPFVSSRASPQNNPFVERPPPDVPPAHRASLVEGPSFRDLHAEAAPQGLLPAALSQDRPAAPVLHDNQPLAFSTPSLGDEAVSSSGFDFPSPIVPPAPSEGSAAGGLLDARLSLALPPPSTDATAPSVSPVETRPADEVPVQWTTSPHLVKPISTSRPVEKQRRSSLPLSQEKLKPKPASSHDSAPPILPLEKTDLKREEPSLPDCSAKYYHLTHDELIQLLLKREAELGKKQEHIRELENYIDRLLVRIMEQSPTLLQIPLGGGARAAK